MASLEEQAGVQASEQSGIADPVPDPFPLRGVLLVVASTLFLAGSDAVTKMMGNRLPPFEIVWFRFAIYLGLVLVVVAIGAVRSKPVGLRPRRMPIQVLRGVLAFGSAALFTGGLQVLPVADATAISFINPLIIALLSAALLGERLGWRRALSSAGGFAGVLLVIGPLGGDSGGALQPSVLFPVLSALCWAGAVVLTRLDAVEAPVVTMAWTGGVSVALASVALPVQWVTPSPADFALALFIGAATTAGHALIVFAYRLAPASLLAPFSYIQIVWASLFGVLLFRTLPEPLALGGVALIVGSGLVLCRPVRPAAAA